MTTLPEDYATVCTVPHRDTVLRQVLNDYVRRYGSDTPLDLDRLNNLLAAHRHNGLTLCNRCQGEERHGEVAYAQAAMFCR